MNGRFIALNPAPIYLSYPNIMKCLLVQIVESISNKDKLLSCLSYILAQQMKINFDELFADNGKHRFAPEVVNLPISLIDSSPYQNINLSMLEQASSEFQYVQMSRMNNRSVIDSVSAQDKLQNLTRLIKEKISMQNQQKKVDIQGLTNKFYKPPPCSKKECLDYKTKKQEEKDLEILHIHASKMKNHKSSVDILCPEDKMPAYVRLYHLNKINELRHLEKYNQSVKPLQRQKSKSSICGQSYLKNYVPFYDRLESQVNKSQEKIKFYENNPQFASGFIKKMFKPELIPNKYSRKAEAKYNKDSSKQTRLNTEIDNHAVNSSLNKSLSSLDRSLDIISKVQQHFFDRMKCIFINENSKLITINEAIIQLLSEVQFKILQDFIISIQQNSVDEEEFQDKLRDYYYNLPYHEKQELRSHQTKRKHKTSSILTSQVSLHSNSNLSKRDRKSKNPMRKFNDYHKKMESFI